MKSDLWGEGFVAVADDSGNAGERGQLFGGALGVAAGGDDAGIGVEAMGAANVGTGFAIGFGRDAAGVYDHHIGLGVQSFRCAGGTQESGYGFAISASGPAAEVLDVEGRGHRFSLAELAGIARCAR